MTLEKTLTIEPQDILAVQLICECGSKLCVPIQKAKDGIPERCVQCRTPWAQRGTVEWDSVRQLADNLHDMMSALKERRFRVRLEVAASSVDN